MARLRLLSIKVRNSTPQKPRLPYNWFVLICFSTLVAVFLQYGFATFEFEDYFFSLAARNSAYWNSDPLTSDFIVNSRSIILRTFAERQGFLSEQFDGMYVITNRKLATGYLKRFSDIHKGLTCDDLPGTIREGGIPYSIIRQRYLSLDGRDVDYLKNQYPGYTYLLTELGHNLSYRTVYSNEYFIIYDLSQRLK